MLKKLYYQIMAKANLLFSSEKDSFLYAAELYSNIIDIEKREVEKSISNKTINPKLYLQRAYAYIKADRFELAMNDIHSSKDGYGGNIPRHELKKLQESLLLFAEQLYKINRDYEKAIECYSLCIDAGTKDCDIYRTRALCYSYTGKNDLAIKDYTRAIEIDSDDYLSYKWRSECYEKMEDYKNAISDIQMYMDINERLNQETGCYELHDYDFSERGKLYAKNEEYDKAVADLKKAIELDETNEYNYFDLADIYKQMKNYNDALAVYEKLFLLLPNQNILEFLYNDRAYLYDEMGEKEKVMDDFENLISLNPAEGYESRGYFYKNKKDYQKALCDFEKLTELEGNIRYKGFFAKADVYAEIGEKEKALNCYNELIELLPESCWPYFNRAEFYEKIGEPDKAKEDKAKAEKIKAEYGDDLPYDEEDDEECYNLWPCT